MILIQKSKLCMFYLVLLSFVERKINPHIITKKLKSTFYEYMSTNSGRQLLHFHKTSHETKSLQRVSHQV